jgi:tape measure domain-containing protein
MALNLGNLIVNLSVNSAKMNRGLTVAEKRLQKFDEKITRIGQGMKNLGFQMTAFVSLPILGIGISAVKSAAQMETLVVQFETLLGSQARAIQLMDDLKKFSAETPFQIQGVANAAGILLTMKRTVNEVKKDLKSLGDIAAATPASIEELAGIFAKIIGLGKVQAEELRQLVERRIPILDVLGKMLGKTSEQLFKMAERGELSSDLIVAAFRKMTGEGGIFEDLMKKMSNTMTGVFSNFIDNLELLKIEFGDMIVQTLELKKVFKGIIESLERVKNAFKSMDANTRKSIISVILIVAAIGPLLLILGTLVLAIKAVIAIVITLKAILAATLFNPVVIGIVAVIVLLAALVAMWIEVAGEGETFFEKMESLMGKDILNWEHWVKTISSFFLILASNAMKLWANIKAGFEQFKLSLEAALTELFTLLAAGTLERSGLSHSEDLALNKQLAMIGDRSAEVERQRRRDIEKANKLLKVTLPPGPKKPVDTPPAQTKKTLEGPVKKFTNMVKAFSVDDFRIRNQIPLKQDKNLKANQDTASNTNDIKEALGTTNNILEKLSAPKPANIQ